MGQRGTGRLLQQFGVTLPLVLAKPKTNLKQIVHVVPGDQTPRGVLHAQINDVQQNHQHRVGVPTAPWQCVGQIIDRLGGARGTITDKTVQQEFVQRLQRRHGNGRVGLVAAYNVQKRGQVANGRSALQVVKPVQVGLQVFERAEHR